ncbi:alpha/beta hydrolase fold domain-containing protein [Actinopolyspora sp. H202]|uniref:alpha/beta hydrolase fold domain-containing protein n=1 Tax=Actinopolyspora sp. H202 TaxID=1500456 RepID=UPI003EE67DFB
MLSADEIELFQRLAVPAGTDPRELSPLHAPDLTGLPAAQVVVPTVNPLADQDRRYADRLRTAAVPVIVAEHRGVTHSFPTMPGLVPQARAARRQITAFLHEHLTV